MKRVALVTATIALLALTGCSGNAAPDAPSQPVGFAGSGEADRSEAATVAELSTEDERFLEYVRAELLPDTQISDWADADLINVGHEACDQLKSGVAIEDVRVIPDEKPGRSGDFIDSLTVRSGAEQFYCPETLG